MRDRVEAAAQAIAVYTDCDWEAEAAKARATLAAADAVMFSPENLSRVCTETTLSMPELLHIVKKLKGDDK